MSANEMDGIGDINVDVNNLYREESYTDLKVAQIRKLVPVKIDGTPDDTRQPIYSGQSHVLTPSGPLPIQCQMEATTLEEAIEKFPEAAKASIEQMMEQVREYQRQEASKIVVPDAGQAGSIIT